MSLRECRLIVERLFVAAGAHPGLVPGARDVAVAAEVLGLGLLRAVHDDADLIRPTASPRAEVRETSAGVQLIADDVLSIYLAPALRDLLLELPAGATVSVTGVRRPEWLEAIALTPGLESIELTPGDGGAIVRLGTEAAASAPRAERVRAAIDHAQRVGLAADPELWFALYVRSNDALAEDTAQSRAHAGYRDVDEAGRIVKQMDDDTDLEHALRNRVAS